MRYFMIDPDNPDRLLTIPERIVNEIKAHEITDAAEFGFRQGERDMLAKCIAVVSELTDKGDTVRPGDVLHALRRLSYDPEFPTQTPNIGEEYPDNAGLFPYPDDAGETPLVRGVLGGNQESAQKPAQSSNGDILGDVNVRRHRLEHSDETLTFVHHEDSCIAQYCTIHRMSDHKMRSFPQHWREDAGFMERICPHGIGHPDPDEYALTQYPALRSHGCDGCCAPGYDPAAKENRP